MIKWDNDWTKELKDINYDCWLRLAECRNKPKDIKIMFKLMYKYNFNRSKEACLDRIATWVCDWNNQPELFDYIESNYDIIINS